MRIIFLILVLVIVTSCSQNDKDKINSDILNTILENQHFADSNLFLLNFKQGQFAQQIQNDTAILIYNGFVTGRMPNISDEFSFNNLDTLNTSFFEFQGNWNDRFTLTHNLPIKYLKKIDSIPNDYKNEYYDFNWQVIPASIHGFVSFSEPIYNKANTGFIGQLTYLKDRFYLKTIWFDLNNGITIKEFSCDKFKVPYYSIKQKDGSVFNIIPGLLVADGPC